MRALVSILFGVRNNKVGWVSESEINLLPNVGMVIPIRFGEEDDHPLEGQVYRAWEDEDGDPGGMVIYAGETIPDELFQESMETSGWERLTDEALKVLSDIIDETPVLAAIHEVVLIVGDPAREDRLLAFQRSLTPYDPALPLFSQRLRLDLAQDVDKDEYDDAEEEGEELTEEEWRVFQENETRGINGELADNSLIDGLIRGIPAITIYSALVRSGLGRVAFWTSSLGNLTAEHLVENDWEELRIPQQLDPRDFRLSERVNLAKQSIVSFEITDFGTARIRDWTMESPLLVGEDQYSLLPQMLVEHVKAASEFTHMDDYLAEWSRDSGWEDAAGEDSTSNG